MKNILITGPYIPGKNFGGPVKSILNMVESLSHKYNFHIITGDRDLNAKSEYEDVNIGEWNKIGKANVFYVPKGKDLKYIRTILNEKKFDLIYASSLFAKQSVIMQMLKLLKVFKCPLIVAPRGEFSSGALQLKSTKKRLFLRLYKLLKINKKVIYTCSSETDKQDIINELGNEIDIQVAGNIIVGNTKEDRIREKKTGKLNIVTISRIVEIKNIDYSLELLKKIDDMDSTFREISFDIYGPLENQEYWEQCLSILKNIGSRIKVNYKGTVDYDDVINTLSNYHIFLLPSKGENFGHVIQEALLAGCPVIISNRTPWDKLEELSVGYDISLDRQDLFIKAIKQFLYMSYKDYNKISDSASSYGRYQVKHQKAIQEHIKMFRL